ncbi:FtsW/RodA/SpoVE family cell cycle protein [Ectobacillus panaciterrae]|uniref:FtsW/RodA/SpoVE family cell cycle protein n=1 Tax=Ectobacillus panaciterrae TaxID=363872 RepID=UPI0009D78B25|nr:FtsW/RodA/SpoVE family cell cycle protein [Ectobacillus panaciterrae]
MKKAWMSLDYSLVLPTILLCTIGVIMVYSASSVVAITRYGYASNHFFVSQLRAMGGGLFALLIMFRMRYSVWKRRGVALCIQISTLALLVLVLWKGTVVNHAQSWIFGMQPAEFTKLAVILVVARFYAKKHELSNSYIQGVGRIGMYLFSVFILIYKEPALGTALLIVGVAGTMTFCSGARINLLSKRVGLTALVLGPALYFVIQAKLSSVQKARIQTFIDPFHDPSGNSFQLINSFIGIASGGIRGLGLGNSIQKTGYLPEPHTDFIMAIVSEELGFLGIAVILAAILTIVLRAFQLAKKSQDPFASMLTLGIGSMLAIQSIVNIGGITGMLPLTGVPFPFISFGGSSLVVNLASVGLLLNISARVKEQEKKQVSAPQKPYLVVGGLPTNK